MNIWFYNIADI